jgi:hypothetical protein
LFWLASALAMEIDSQMSTRQMRMASGSWREVSMRGRNQPAVQGGRPLGMVPMGLMYGDLGLGFLYLSRRGRARRVQA